MTEQPHPHDMAREQVEQFLADTRAWVDQAQRAENAAALAAGLPARTARIQYLPGLRSVKCTFLPEEPQHEPPPYPERRETDAEKIARLEASSERHQRRAARANERVQDLTREAQERGLALARAKWDAERLEHANANLRASHGATDETLTIRAYIDLNADTDVMTIRQAGKDDLPANVYDVPVHLFWSWTTAHWQWHETQLRIVRDYLVPRDKEAEAGE